MPKIKGLQHFFTSVPADQSPNKRRGYQTLFRSASLRDDFVPLIEHRTQYFSAPNEPIKRQFYRLPDGWVAISRMVALDELDEFGRKGRYLAHTLVLDANDFEVLDHCPLDALDQVPFVDNLKQVFAQCQISSLNAPDISIDVKLEWKELANHAAQSLKQADIPKLGRLAWQADRLAQQSQPVALLGSYEQMRDVLAILFWLTAPNQRTLLSFDTHAAGCQWGSETFFWMQGFEDVSEFRTTHIIDARTKTITNNLATDNDTSYAKWLIANLHSSVFGSDQQNWAGQLDTALSAHHSSKQPIVDLGHIPTSFVEDFAQACPQSVVTSWEAHFPSELSNITRQHLLNVIKRKPSKFLQFIIAGDAKIGWREVILPALFLQNENPSRSDLPVLTTWFNDIGDPLLQTLPYFWQSDAKQWSLALTALSTSEFEWLTQQIYRRGDKAITYWDGIVENHLESWFKLFGSHLFDADLKHLFSRLERLGDSAVDRSVEFVRSLKSSSQQEITEWLRKYSGDAPQLRDMLQVPKPKSFRLFGRK